MEPAPHTGPRPDHETAMRSGLRYTEARWQCPPGAAADQHIDDRGKQRLIRRVLRPATLRPHLRRRDQRPRDLPQPVRNNPTPRTPPHTQLNEPSPHRTRSYSCCSLPVTASSGTIRPSIKLSGRQGEPHDRGNLSRHRDAPSDDAGESVPVPVRVVLPALPVLGHPEQEGVARLWKRRQTETGWVYLVGLPSYRDHGDGGVEGRSTGCGSGSPTMCGWSMALTMRPSAFRTCSVGPGRAGMNSGWRRER
jgi:hypothetical protein